MKWSIGKSTFQPSSSNTAVSIPLFFPLLRVLRTLNTPSKLKQQQQQKTQKGMLQWSLTQHGENTKVLGPENVEVKFVHTDSHGIICADWLINLPKPG